MTTPCCPKCGLPLNVKTYPSSGLQDAECLNPDCNRYVITRSVEVLLKMTDAQAETYQAARRRSEESRQRWLEQQAASRARHGDRQYGE